MARACVPSPRGSVLGVVRDLSRPFCLLFDASPADHPAPLCFLLRLEENTKAAAVCTPPSLPHTPVPVRPRTHKSSQQIQQTVARVTEVCWDKCVGYPGRSLSGRESSCMADCAKRFIETTQFIVQRFQAKAGAGADAGGGGGLFE
jgi:mitochondrial import inner membrane translocase subunit TIM8